MKLNTLYPKRSHWTLWDIITLVVMISLHSYKATKHLRGTSWTTDGIPAIAERLGEGHDTTKNQLIGFDGNRFDHWRLVNNLRTNLQADVREISGLPTSWTGRWLWECVANIALGIGTALYNCTCAYQAVREWTPLEGSCSPALTNLAQENAAM